MFDWAIAGVNVSLPGEGGAECAAYLPLPTRIYESVVVLGVALGVFIWAQSNPSLSRVLFPKRNGCKNLSKPDSDDHRVVETVEGLGTNSSCNDEWKNKHVTNINAYNEEDNLIKDSGNLYTTFSSNENRLIFESLRQRNKNNWLLVLICLIWGAEIGFKFASRTVIYLLNPCHVVTAVQIYLLAAEPSYQVTVIFRIHLYFLNGAILAFLFPNTDSRILPCETSLYWIQHTMMLVVPIYLLCQKGVYNVEPIRDISWGALSFAINIVYHFAFLQPIALLSEINLNQLLCPAQLDPFRGTYYRTAAVIHQSLLCPLVAKAYSACASLLTSSSHVNAESTDGHPCQVSKTLSCDKNSSEASEKAPLPKNSVVDCKSCYEKNVSVIPNVNHDSDNLNIQVANSESVDQNVVNPLDNVNASGQAHESPSHLRLRKTLNFLDK